MPAARPPHPSVPLAVGVGLVGLVAAPWPAVQVGCGVLAALAGLQLAAPAWARVEARAPWLGEALGPLGLVGAVLAVHPFLLRLDPPSHGDHAIHLAKAVWTWTELLPKGQLVGFSDAADFGWPLHALYPPGASWLVLLFEGLSLGALRWEQAYALALLVGLSALPLGLYALGRAPLGRAGAFVAGLLAATQLGAAWQGGYLFDVVVGVWGTSAATGCALLACAAAHRALSGGARWVTAGALATAAAVLLHPFAMVVLGLLAPARLGLGAWRRDDGAEGPGWAGVGRGAASLGIGLLLAAGWWLPFGQRAPAWALAYGGGWRPLGALVEGLVRGETLGAIAPVLVLGGLVGLLLVGRLRPSFGAAALLAFGLTLALGSDEAFVALGLGRVFPGLEEVQLVRLAYLLKALVFLGAGAWAGPATGVPTRWSPALTAVFAALVVANGVPQGLAPFPQPQTVATDPDVPALRELARFLDERRQAELYFFRTALAPGAAHEHRLLWLPVFAPGLPVARLSFHAAETFRFDTGGLTPALLRAQDVRFIVAPSDAAPRDGFRPVVHAGRFAVLEWEGFRPGERAHLVSAAGAEPPGAVTVERFDAASAVLRVHEAPPGARLVLHRAPYATLRASVDGAEVPLKPWRVGESLRSQVASVDAAVGTLTVQERPGLPERLGLALSLLALVLLVGWRGGFEAFVTQRARQLVGLGLLLGGLAAGLGCARAWRLLPAPFSARAWLGDAQVSLGGQQCTRLGAERGFSCGPAPWQVVHASREAIEQVMRRCVYAHPSAGQPLTLRWEDVPLDGALVLEHGLVDGSLREGPGADVTLAVSAGGQRWEVVQRPSELWAEARFDTAALRGQRHAVELTLTTANDRWRQECLELRVDPAP